MNDAPNPLPADESDDVIIRDGHLIHTEKKEESINMEKVEQDNVEYDD
jgi:hypothetical protein